MGTGKSQAGQGKSQVGKGKSQVRARLRPERARWRQVKSMLAQGRPIRIASNLDFSNIALESSGLKIFLKSLKKVENGL